MASSEEHDHTIVHSDRMRDPGDYYDTKAAKIRDLRDAVAQAEAAYRAARTSGDWKRVPQLGSEVARLREALERALYVDD